MGRRENDKWKPTIALGAGRYKRHGARRGYRNGVKTRTLTGPTGPMALTLPRATMVATGHGHEWTSTIVPRYQRRMPEVNEVVVATSLAGGNTRRIRGALQLLLKAVSLSKSAVSRVTATLKDGLEAWRTRSLADFHRIAYAASADTARGAFAAFEHTWSKRCPGVVTSLREGGDAAVVPRFSLVASGQIKLRRIDGWRKIAAVLSQHTPVAA